jgi:hypothetical protein
MSERTYTYGELSIKYIKCPEFYILDKRLYNKQQLHKAFHKIMTHYLNLKHEPGVEIININGCEIDFYIAHIRTIKKIRCNVRIIKSGYLFRNFLYKTLDKFRYSIHDYTLAPVCRDYLYGAGCNRDCGNMHSIPTLCYAKKNINTKLKKSRKFKYYGLCPNFDDCREKDCRASHKLKKRNITSTGFNTIV